MKILIACEYSGRVRDAFTALGHDAISCDYLPSRTAGKHYKGNVFDIINDGFDMLIGFPPCTFITNVNTKWRNNIERLKQACDGMKFFADLYSAAIERICLENPVGMLNSCFRKPDQIVSPVYFGGCEQKKTCLWLKNLPLLIHSEHETLFEHATHGILSGEGPEDLQKSVIKKVIVTDTIGIRPNRRFSKLEVISIASLITKELRK